MKQRLGIIALLLTTFATPVLADPPSELKRWLGPQSWERDTAGPILSLGAGGDFDDMHIFAPCVALLDQRYQLWYCGSRDRVAERVFRLGLASSDDGKQFEKAANNPVLQFADGRHSVLTPTLLRQTDGTPIRENGKLRMWFAATDFLDQSETKGLHTLHESTSDDAIHWSQPSPAQLDHVYAPSIVNDGDRFHLWYTDVKSEPWIFRHAVSDDGRHWMVDADPIMTMGQDWENGRLFYCTVVKHDGVFLMWYGSYLANNSNHTATGSAASLDGRKWYKNPNNPVLRPAPEREWESNYTTSQSVIRNADGSWRIWYASRKKPPFLNKYFAINTARWKGP